MTRNKIGRNDPCPCGSGMKYKKCCEGSESSPRAAAARPIALQPVRVPPVITNSVRVLIDSVASGSSAVRISVRPRADAQMRDCFPAVDRQVAEFGGRAVYGWAIWETQPILVEAEFHAVWESPDGEWQCVSPNAIRAREILFVPDPHRRYEDMQVNNIRHAMLPWPEIAAWIRTLDREFEVMNRGERARQHQVVLGPADTAALDAIYDARSHSEYLIGRRLANLPAEDTA